MAFRNLNINISDSFKSKYNCGLLESYCQIEGISILEDEPNYTENKYTIFFVNSNEIKKSKKNKIIYVLHVSENSIENIYSANIDSTYELQELFADFRKIDNQLEIYKKVIESHQELEIQKNQILDINNESLIMFFKNIIELEFRLLKIKSVEELNEYIENFRKDSKTFTEIRLIQEDYLREIDSNAEFYCFRVIDNNTYLYLQAVNVNRVTWAKIEILINSITKYYNNPEGGLIKNSGETNFLKKVFSYLDYPLAMISDDGDLLVYNEKFANLEISPKGCLKIQDAEFIEMDDEFYRLKRTAVSIDDIKAYYFIFFTEEEKYKEQVNKNENNSENSVDELGIISSSIAHELNNPFAGILAALTLLSLEEWPEDVKTDIVDMQNSARRCKDLVEIFLGFSRYSPTQSHLMNLEYSFNQAINLLRFRMIESNLRIDFQYSVSFEKFNAQINSSVCAMIFYLIFSEMMTAFAHHKLITSSDTPIIRGTVVEFSNQFVIKLDDLFEFETNISSSKLIHYLLKFEKLKITFSQQEVRIYLSE